MAEPTPIKRVERINVIVVHLQQQAEFVPRYNSYTINVNQGRNCYNCREFGHITRNYRNQEIVG